MCNSMLFAARYGPLLVTTEGTYCRPRKILKETAVIVCKILVESALARFRHGRDGPGTVVSVGDPASLC
jgi:hypothetical protein